MSSRPTTIEIKVTPEELDTLLGLLDEADRLGDVKAGKLLRRFSSKEIMARLREIAGA